MFVLNVPRAERLKRDYMPRLINNMFHDKRVIARQGFGVFENCPEAVIDAFCALRNDYCKINKIAVHYIEIFVKKDVALDIVKGLATELGNFLLTNGFLSFVSILSLQNSYLIAIALNAVSLDGNLFHDNNTWYEQIYRYLTHIIPEGWKLSTTDNTFFDPHAGTNNYLHGVLI